MIETLGAIADQCDGVRCDMAMLTMNDVFARTWGDRVGPAPASDYWPTRHSRGPRPRTQGSCSWPRPTGTWNGRCNSRASTSATTNGSTTASRHGPPRRCAVTSPATCTYQEHLVRFVENHDEPRAAAAFGARQAPVAAVAALTQTGARLHPSRPAHRAANPAAGVPGSVPGRADRPRGGRVLPHPAGRARRPDLPSRPVAARRVLRVARLGSGEPGGLVLGRRHPVARRGQPR